MVRIKRAISVFIVTLMLFTAVSVNAAQDVKGDEGTITEHLPHSRVSDEIELSVGGGSKWLWVLLGVAVVAVGVAVFIGDDDSENPPSTGNYGVTW